MNKITKKQEPISANSLSAQLNQIPLLTDPKTQINIGKFAHRIAHEENVFNFIDLSQCNLKKRRRMAQMLNLKPQDTEKRSQFYQLFNKLKEQINCCNSDEEKLLEKFNNSNENKPLLKHEAVKPHINKSKPLLNHKMDKKQELQNESCSSDNNFSFSSDESNTLSIKQNHKHKHRSKRRKAKSTTKSEDSDGNRSSDDEYEMEFENISEILEQATSKENIDKILCNTKDQSYCHWKPLKFQKRMINGRCQTFSNSQYLEIPLQKALAGSIHQIRLFLIRETKDATKIFTRIVKFARSSNDDTCSHFETEFESHRILIEIASAINLSYHIRTEMCIWPCELIAFTQNSSDEELLKYGLAQAPFLPGPLYEFSKIEPNSGKPNENDRIVGRYQHAFAAFARGMYLIRDWQGFSVPIQTFKQQCQHFDELEALKQTRVFGNLGEIEDDRIEVKKTGFASANRILVVIDPVLTSADAHYIRNNSTDFGIEAMDEQQSSHNCKECRCSFFGLLPKIEQGLSDPDQCFFYDELSKFRVSKNKVTSENCSNKCQTCETENIKTLDSDLELLRQKICKNLNIWNGCNFSDDLNTVKQTF